MVNLGEWWMMLVVMMRMRMLINAFFLAKTIGDREVTKASSWGRSRSTSSEKTARRQVPEDWHRRGFRWMGKVKKENLLNYSDMPIYETSAWMYVWITDKIRKIYIYHLPQIVYSPVGLLFQLVDNAGLWRWYCCFHASNPYLTYGRTFSNLGA
jgi:hypothetical protein